MSTMPTIYEPMPTQARVHASSDDWLVLGGNRGGGKTEAVLIEALGLAYGTYEKTGWQVLILRRTSNRMESMISRSKVLYPKIIKGIKYDSTNMIWKFPNGNWIKFGHIEHDEMVSIYQGQQYSLIIMDELSELNRNIWDTLKASNRNSYGYPNRMIGTTNPVQWVKDMCNINDKGEDTFQIIKWEDPDSGEITNKTLRFIQMTHQETIKYGHLDQSYRASIASNQNDTIREQWLNGSWATPKVPGRVLGPELDLFRAQNRLLPIKQELALPVHCFTDLGWSDSTSLLFCQFIGNNINILDYYENSQCITDHYINIIKERFPDSIVHMPHDGTKHDEHTGQMKRDYWKDRVRVAHDSGANGNLPRPGSDKEALTRVQTGFSRIYINSESEGALKFLNHLDNYARRYIDSLNMYGDPIEGIHSHPFDALKYVFYYVPSSTTNWATYKSTIPSYGY